MVKFLDLVCYYLKNEQNLPIQVNSMCLFLKVEDFGKEAYVYYLGTNVNLSSRVPFKCLSTTQLSGVFKSNCFRIHI